MGSDTGDGWCLGCGDYFHLDDCGGYNPPCPGCGNCRGCCECEGDRDRDPDDYPFDEEELEVRDQPVESVNPAEVTSILQADGGSNA